MFNLHRGGLCRACAYETRDEHEGDRSGDGCRQLPAHGTRYMTERVGWGLQSDERAPTRSPLNTAGSEVESPEMESRRPAPGLGWAKMDSRRLSFAKILSQRLNDSPAACEPRGQCPWYSLCWARSVRRSGASIVS